jgi:5-methylcytosine-specific restriction endonuclease McrA
MNQRKLKMTETKTCASCRQLKPLSDYYDKKRYLCIECERVSAAARMRRYNRTLRGKAANALKHSRRVAKKYGCQDDLTLMDVIFTFCMADGECSYCAKVTSDYELEHIIPLSAGGPNTLSNITVACPQCNRSKHAKNLLDWRELDDVTHLIAQIASRKGVPIAEVLEEFSDKEGKEHEKEA